VALWYPTLATPASYAYSNRFSGLVARDAPPACGPLPLVVFSHGLGGCGTQSLFFTEELARHGYVVAAPDHDDATFCTVDNTRGSFRNLRPQQPLGDPLSWTDQTYIDRRDDLEDLIDALLADPVFAVQIDPNAIGAAGHSLGGYTVLGLGGAWSSWKDPRVKAVLALSPYIQPFTAHQTLPAMQVPVMYQGAQFDVGETPWLQGPNGAYAQSNPPKYFAELRAASHFIWSNVACSRTSSVQECLALPNPSLIDAYGSVSSMRISRAVHRRCSRAVARACWPGSTHLESTSAALRRGIDSCGQPRFPGMLAAAHPLVVLRSLARDRPSQARSTRSRIGQVRRAYAHPVRGAVHVGPCPGDHSLRRHEPWRRPPR